MSEDRPEYVTTSLEVTLENDEQYREIVFNGLPQADLPIFTTSPERKTTSGRPLVAISFSVMLPDGTQRTAQAVITLRSLLTAAEVLQVRYGRDGEGPGTRQ